MGWNSKIGNKKSYHHNFLSQETTLLLEFFLKRFCSRKYIVLVSFGIKPFCVAYVELILLTYT